jgi:hypothetical protein
MTRHRAEHVLREESALADATASSVDPIEAAVVLESAGMNDRVARDLFGAHDVLMLAERVMTHEGPDRPVADPVPVRPQNAGGAARRATFWFHLRGVLYAVPALVTLTLLPAVDPVESALVLGSLVLSWAWSYGVAGIAWAHLGNQDPAGARRFLRRALVGGVLLAAVLATVVVYAALIVTSTLQVDLLTVLLLTGQSTYLLAAATLLMTGRELLLLVAVCPAVAALGLGLTGRMPADALRWVGAGVLLAVLFALVATRRSARPRQRLGATAWATALQQACYGLLVAVAVLFPAINELVNDNYDALPLSVTLAALPLVVSMGIAEILLTRFRSRMSALLATTSSSAAFARSARRALLRYEVAFVVPLAATSAALGVAVEGVTGTLDARYGLLAGGYVVLGTAIFTAMLLNLLGRGRRVLATLAATVAALVAFEVHAVSVTATDTEALAWLAIVATVTLVVHLVLVRRYVAVPVSHR